MKITTLTKSLICSSLTVLSLSSAQAQTFLATPGTDASPYYTTGIGFPPSISLPQSSADGINSVGGSTLQTANPGSQLGNAIFVFQLPDVGAISNPFTDATFSVTLAATSGQSAFGFNAFNNNYDLYGLTGSFDSTVTTGQYYAGSSAPDTLLQNNFAGNDGGVSADTLFTKTGSNLVDYLNGQYADGAGASAYVFLRINPNFNPSSFSNFSWYSTTSGITPAQLSVTTLAVPEPSTCAFLAAGAVALLFFGRFRRSSAV